MKHLDYFFHLKSSGDILRVVAPLNRCAKEITEAVSVFKCLRPFALKTPMEYRLLDLCAGNGLLSVLCAHVLPFRKIVAMDKRRPNRDWGLVHRFSYREVDIFSDEIWEHIDENTIITSIHPCSKLALRIIELYCYSPAAGLVLCPCCGDGAQFKEYIPGIIREKIGPYLGWSWYLSRLVQGRLKVDKNSLSPCNAIVVASGEKPYSCRLSRLFSCEKNRKMNLGKV